MKFDKYRSSLAKYVDAISGKSKKILAPRPPLFLLTHFTDANAADSIVRDFAIKTGSRGYTALSALSPLEFKPVITGKRKFGFGFFLDDLKSLGLYTPVAYCGQANIVDDLRDKDLTLAERVLCEPTDTQESISFLNQMEVRTNNQISLDRCAVFFRNEDLPNVDKKLNDAGIFQMPFASDWYNDHFLKQQMWYMHETEDSIEFFDNRVCRYETGKVLDALSKLTKNE